MDAIELVAKWRELSARVARLKREIRVLRAQLTPAAEELAALEAAARRRGISFTTVETAIGVEGDLHGRSPSRS